MQPISSDAALNYQESFLPRVDAAGVFFGAVSLIVDVFLAAALRALVFGDFGLAALASALAFTASADASFGSQIKPTNMCLTMNAWPVSSCVCCV